MTSGNLSRSRSEDSSVDTQSSRRTNGSRRTTHSRMVGSTPIKVVTRLRPCTSEERKRAVFVDWSSVSDDEMEPSPIAEEQDQSSSASQAFQTPPRKGKAETTTNGSDVTPPTRIQNPSPSKISSVSRRRWNRNRSKGQATSLIVESKQLSPGPSHTQARHFSFDAVLTEETSQAQTYQQTVGNAVRRNLFRGYNTTICAYGQVGSGKSYTMYGPPRPGEKDCLEETVDDCMEEESSYIVEQNTETIHEDDGIIPRAMKDVFGAIAEYPDHEFSFKMTFMEIYRDELRDLFVDRSPLPLQLFDHHHEHGNVVVHGLRSIPVHNLSQALKLIKLGHRRRTTTRSLSHASSRSHAICTFHLTMTPSTSTANGIVGKVPAVKAKALTAKLTLVDLAGSERLVHSPRHNRSNAEAITINKDLFVLGKVVAALASSPVGHVPYRDSKLTRIMRDSIGGNCCTVFVACVSPAEINLEESLHTLRYASRARNVSQTVRKNILQSPLSAHDASFLRAENQRLRARLEQYEGGAQMTEFASLQTKLFKAEAEAKRAREHAKSVRQTADKWKDQFEKIKVARKRMHRFRSSMSFRADVDEEAVVCEASTDETTDPGRTAESITSDNLEENLDALLRDDFESPVVVSPDVFATVHEMDAEASAGLQNADDIDEDISKNMDEAPDEKLRLTREIAEMTRNLAEQRAKMAELNEEYNFRQVEMAAYIAKQEEVRDHLDKEVDALKVKLHLVASETKENSALSHSVRVSGKEKASKTATHNNTDASVSSQPNIDELVKQLDGKVLECQDLQKTVERLTAENLQLHEANDRLRTEMQNTKESRTLVRKSSGDMSLGSLSRTSGTVGTVGTAENDLFISNLNDMMKNGICVYELSPLATNSTQIEFYLPKLRVFCPCGKHSVAEDSVETDPRSMSSILRPWQLEFLATCGVTHTLHLVHGAKRRSSELAKKMRKWRRKKKLPTFRTPSCAVALHIWSRTCLRVLQSINEQQTSGAENPVLPDFLEFKLDPDLYTVNSDLQSQVTRG